MPDFQLPNSPDLNPCDYAILVILEAKIWKHNQFQIKTLKDLKQQILEEWVALQQDVISRTITWFRKRVYMVIKKNGEQTETYIQTEKVTLLFVSAIGL